MAIEDWPLLERAKVCVDEMTMPVQARQVIEDLVAEVVQLREWQHKVAEAGDIEPGIGSAYLDPDTAAAWMREFVAEAGRLRTVLIDSAVAGYLQDQGKDS